MRLGELDLSTRNTSNDIDIKHLIRHPEYNSKTHENDIALIELNRSVNFDKIFIRPACLMQKEFYGESLIAVRTF